jgi:hypothetical protein
VKTIVTGLALLITWPVGVSDPLSASQDGASDPSAFSQHVVGRCAHPAAKALARQGVNEDRGAGGDVERLHVAGAGDGDDCVADIERGARQSAFLVAEDERERLVTFGQRR